MMSDSLMSLEDAHYAATGYPLNEYETVDQKSKRLAIAGGYAKEDITVKCPGCDKVMELPGIIAELDYYQCIDCRYMIDLKAQKG